MTTIPPSFHDDEQMGFRGPWSFLRQALPGGGSAAGLQLMAAWAAAAILPAWFWARHLAAFAGRSALPNHWGERLPMRDIVELWTNGKWGEDPIGTLPLLVLLACLIWVFWAGWRMQAELLGRRPSLGTWVLGLVEALALGLLPLGFVCWIVLVPVNGVGGIGVPTLSWTGAILRPLLIFAVATAVSLQWSFCRVGHLLGEDESWPRHLGHSFLRLWAHPIQWTLLALAAAALRLGLSLVVVVLFWRWSGSSSLRVLGFALTQGFVAALVAWTLGWQLRLAALFTRHDAGVRAEQRRLREAADVAKRTPILEETSVES